MSTRFAKYIDALASYPKPQAFLDLDLFDENLASLLERAQGVPIRLASKSVRCPDLLRHALSQSEQLKGLMCFHAFEAVELAKMGFDDLLVAYPTTDAHGIQAVCEQLLKGHLITLMVDCAAQVKAISAVAVRNNVCVPLCMDVDMSMHLPGLNFGVYRSPIRSVEQALALYQVIEQQPSVRLDGVMGYEAQVAGLPDHTPGQGVKNKIIQQLKKRSIQQLQKRRKNVVAALKKAGAELAFVNGGGTGSLESTVKDTSITEISVGSGLYSPSLFDHYQGFSHKPSLFFALEVCRQPAPNIITCLGGGYVASGSAGKDKLPIPVWPLGLRLLDNEGAGEVQTPLTGKVLPVVGDLVFFRHAKAGELTERFNQLVLLRDGKNVGTSQTYRGLGWQFI